MLFDYRGFTFHVNYLLLLFSAFPYFEFFNLVVAEKTNARERKSEKNSRGIFVFIVIIILLLRAMVLPFAAAAVSSLA